MTNEELYHNDWVSLRIVRAPEKGVKGYVYSTETRCKGKIISILPFRKIPITSKDPKLGQVIRYEYLLKSELTPCWDMEKQVLSTITGGVEGDQPMATAVMELKEETGYAVDKTDLILLGHSYASKSSDTQYFLYSVDLTGYSKGEAEGDGSELEKQAISLWATDRMIRECSDPQASVLFLRLQEHLKNNG